MTQARQNLLVIFLFCLSCSTEAYAAPNKFNSQLAASLMNFNYGEYNDNDNLIDKEYGLLPGVAFSLNYQFKDLQLSGEGSLYANDVTYDGQTQSGTPVQSRTDTFISDFSVRLAQLFDGQKLMPDSVYFGMGYRYWNRNIRDTSTSSGTPVSGVREVYRLPYIQLGSCWNIAKLGRTDWSLDIRLHRTVSAEMDVHIYEGTTLNLGERWGGRASLMIAGIFDKESNYYVEQFLELWQIGKSNPKYNSGAGYIYEPRSTTINLGVNLGVQW